MVSQSVFGDYNHDNIQLPSIDRYNSLSLWTIIQWVPVNYYYSYFSLVVLNYFYAQAATNKCYHYQGVLTAHFPPWAPSFWDWLDWLDWVGWLGSFVCLFVCFIGTSLTKMVDGKKQCPTTTNQYGSLYGLDHSIVGHWFGWHFFWDRLISLTWLIEHHHDTYRHANHCWR